MALLLRLIGRHFAKEKPLDAFRTFLQHDAGASVRQTPHQKDRKYLHVEIAERFKQQQQERKKIRLEQMKLRKTLLEQKITNESKLLPAGGDNQELAGLKGEIASLEQALKEQQQQLAKIDQALQESEGSMVLIEGSKKLVVLNQIEYLKHLSQHPTGVTLHPQTTKIIENVHYLVNNNLPVSKFKLFEIMPDLFQTEIKELDESMQRLIQEKKLDPDSDPSSRIRFFVRHKNRFRHPEQERIDLDEERRAVFENMEEDIIRKMEAHSSYLQLVEQGQTPFRSALHMISTLLSDTLKLNLTPEQQALKATLLQVVKLKDDFKRYSHEIDKKKVQARYRYIQPPVWIKNHPLLLERYEKMMVNYTNPVQVEPTLPIDGTRDDGGREYLSQKLNELVIEKYHPIIEELWNSGRRDELVATKKRLQISFYNDSTRILQEYNDMLLEKKEKEEFLKIPKKPREIATAKYARIRLDDLTKAIVVNNSDPATYGVPFFTNFLGLESEQDTKKLFNSFSYLRVHIQKEQQIKQLDFSVIKFRDR